MTADSATNAGTVLLLIATRDVQSAEQLSKDGGLSPAETALQLQRLAEFGFIVAAGPDAAGLSVYRLNPRGVRTETLDPVTADLLYDPQTSGGLLISLRVGQVSDLPGAFEIGRVLPRQSKVIRLI